MAAAKKKKVTRKAPAKPRVKSRPEDPENLEAPPSKTEPELENARLRASLEQVNATLIKRNDELTAARAVAEKEIFKDIVVMAALLDAKAYLGARGGVEAAVIIQRISTVELRLGATATSAAVVLQKVKALVEKQQAGHEIFPEDYNDLLKSGERLL